MPRKPRPFRSQLAGAPLGTGMLPSKTGLGRFIRDRRIQLQLSQRGLARMLGGTWMQSRLSQLERGVTRRLFKSDVERFARVLAIDPGRLRRLIPPVPLLPALTPLARLVRARREALGLTRDELARRAGSDTLHIGMLERTARGLRYEFARRLARALEIDRAVLAPFTGRIGTAPGNRLGAAIRARRKALGWSAAELGRRVGVSKAAVLNVEQGHVGLTRETGAFQRYARVLGLDVTALGTMRSLPSVTGRTPNARTLGGRLTLCRLGRRWTQEGLARRSGLSPATICKVERSGKAPRRATLARLAHALEVDVASLIRAGRDADDRQGHPQRRWLRRGRAQ
jgi:transcriptional regulator with XRE-family HTH domain